MLQQLPMDFLVPKTGWVPPSLSDLPSDWNRARRICVDVETRDEQLSELGCGARRGAYNVGYAINFDGERKFYLPVRHMGGGNLSAPQVQRYLRDNAKTFTGTIVGANLSYDLDMLAEEGIEFTSASRFSDVLIAEPLLNELENDYSLEGVGQRRLGLGKDENALLEALRAFAPKKTPPTRLKRYLYLLPSSCVGPYAEQDVDLPMKLLEAQEKVIEAEDLGRVWDLESKLLPALVRMRRRGIRIDTDKLEDIKRWSIVEEQKAWDEIHRHTGVRLKVGQSMEGKAVAKVLDALEIPYGMKGAKNNLPSIDKELLSSIVHPVGKLIRRARQMGQLRSTFVASIEDHMTNGRIHCTLNQLRKSKSEAGGDDDTEGGRFGRLSGSNPNLQQQPARDPEIGPMWRSIYLPEEGMLWASKDYSQQEPKWLVECSTRVPIGHPKGWNGQKLGLTPATYQAALDAAARYRDDPKLDCYNDFTIQVFKEMSKEGRKLIKEIYLGRCYGMGNAKMARKMGLETMTTTTRDGRAYETSGPEATRLIESFDASVPYAKEMAQLMETLAKDRGYIRTHSGRRCRFPIVGGEYDWCHKALNRLIQGSSADETKEAVVQLDAAGYFIQIQVHDEIGGSYANKEEAEAAADIMRNAVPKSMPTKVDVECGESWGGSM